MSRAARRGWPTGRAAGRAGRRPGYEYGSAPLGVAVIAFVARAHAGAHHSSGSFSLPGAIVGGVLLAGLLGWQLVKRRRGAS